MIFGTQHSKFVSGANTVTLDYSKIIPNWDTVEVLKQKSILDGTINILKDWSYSSFDVIVNLFHHSNPATKINEIAAYRNTEVNFYPHQDDIAVKTPLNEDATFMFIMEPYYVEDSNHYDVVKLKFISTSLTTYKYTPLYLITEGGTTIITEDGDEIIVN